MKKNNLILLVVGMLTIFLASCSIFGGGKCSHEWGTEIIETQATCAQYGTKLQTCTKCGEEKRDKYILPHQFGEVVYGDASNNYVDYI